MRAGCECGELQLHIVSQAMQEGLHPMHDALCKGLSTVWGSADGVRAGCELEKLE